jgi:hypothetical protein
MKTNSQIIQTGKCGKNRQMKKLLIITVIAFNALSIFAQTQKFDVMTYTPPKGWAAGQNGSAKTFTTIDKAAGKFCLMMLHPSITNHGTPSQDFAYVWKTLVQDTFNAGGNPEKEMTQADGFTIIQGGELIDYEGNKALALLTTVSGEGRVISLLTLMNDAKYADDVQAFLGGMDIDIKETSKPIQPSKTNIPTNVSSGSSDSNFTSQGIEGVWVGYGARLLNDRAKWNWRVFFGNGNSLVGLPERGFYNFNYGSDAKEYASTYTYSNGSGKITYPDGKFHDDIKFSQQNTLFIDGLEYRKCLPVTGLKLNATFSYYLPNDSVINTLPAGQKPRITFSQNGRFQDDGLFFSILKDFTKDEEFNRSGVGSYELKEYSIILKYDDGRVRQESFTVPASKSAGNTNEILVGRLLMHKAK